jgi:hypothetical protein
MTRETIQRANRRRLDTLYSVAPHDIVFRGHSFTGRIEPLSIEAQMVSGGNEISLKGTCYIRIADMTALGLASPAKWEPITVDGAELCVDGLTTSLLYGEYAISLANPQTEPQFS